MPDTPRVFCAICGQAFDPADKAVGYRSLDRRWWCADETECTDRAARITLAAVMASDAQMQAMYRGLDDSWDRLAAVGWRWPA